MDSDGILLFQALFAHKAKLYIAVRNEEKAKKSAITELKEQTGKEQISL